MPFGEPREKKGLFITIDANIGAGKSNACHAIASAYAIGAKEARSLPLWITS